MKNRFSITVAAFLSLAACKESSVSGTAASMSPMASTASRRDVAPAVVAHGSQIYQKNCAVCHGGMAQGAPNWHIPGPDGKYPAPPLNGTGHAWHHPEAALKMTIRDGTARLGGNMPGWKGKLSDDDIDAVIAWMQSVWPEEIYRNWQMMDAKAR